MILVFVFLMPCFLMTQPFEIVSSMSIFLKGSIACANIHIGVRIMFSLT